MNSESKRINRCATYTRKSSEEGLDMSFNSLDAQRESCQAFIASQRHEGWRALPARYDDGGYSGGSMDRPALTQLLKDVAEGKIDTIVVYKVDRLTRSLADFAKIVEALDARGVSFVSVTQQFNTTTSMGRLTLNILLSFAQFEREVTGERIRDKIAASKRKGMWMGGPVSLGYDVKERKLIVNKEEQNLVVRMFRLYLELGCVSKLKVRLDEEGIKSKVRISAAGKRSGGNSYSRGALYDILQNPLYLGEIHHRGQIYPGEHQAIIRQELWDQVQAQLKGDHQGRRNGLKAHSPSLLVGLIQDADGNRFTPAHTSKHGRRYRYYVCQPVRKPGRTPNGPCRLPAHQVESLVLARLKSFLESAHDVIDSLSLPTDSPSLIQQLTVGAQKRSGQWFSDAISRTAIPLKFLHGIVVHQARVEVVLSKRKLREALIPDPSSASNTNPETARDEQHDLLYLNVDARLKRCGGEVRLVVPPRSTGEVPSDQVPSLLKAIARGHDWRARIIAGKVSGPRKLSDQTGLNERYVTRILRCAFLAPDIVEAILDGRQPGDFSLEKLRNGVPLDWAEQRKRFGFPAR